MSIANDTGNERFDKRGRLPGTYRRERRGGPRSLKDGARRGTIRRSKRPADRYTLNSHLETRRIPIRLRFERPVSRICQRIPRWMPRGDPPKCRYRRADVAQMHAVCMNTSREIEGKCIGFAWFAKCKRKLVTTKTTKEELGEIT